MLTVRHLTVYRYAKPVRLGEHRMLFRPRESHDLRLIRTRLTIIPEPTQLRWLHDVFDNSVAIAAFTGETTELRFESIVTLEHVETALPEYTIEPAARTFPFDYPLDDRPDLVRALQRHEPSPDVDRWAATFLPAAGSIDTSELLRSMTLGIRSQLSYSRRERGMQKPAETLRLGSGTCRDFAWLMIDAVRSLGLAARFVSGYILVSSREPLTTLGGGATHAWLQVYLPGAGWLDFDPTNSIIGNRNLIRVAVAWDPNKVLPLWGTFIGPVGAALGMDVTVSVAENPAAIRQTE